MRPRIEAEEYKSRRQKVFAAMEENSVAVLLGGDEVVRSNDTNYPFRVESSFYYLTGFSEPESALVLVKGEEQKSIMFVRARDSHAEQWEGKRLGVENAPLTLNIDEAFESSALNQRLEELYANRSALYFSFAATRLSALTFEIFNKLTGKERRGIMPPASVYNLDLLLSELRLIKSDQEVNCMRYVASASANAHKKAMQEVKHLSDEGQLEGLLQSDLMQHGCPNMAYGSIVAGGENACILHYTENNAALNEGDLVLIDAGGEYLNYAADITRTYPINGRFSKAQKEIYQIVLQAQLAGIELIKPGVCWANIQTKMIQIIVRGLKALNLLKGEVETLIKEKAYLPFYMHSSGHWLGLDVHDVGAYKENNQWRDLKAGMVLTVEPGIYILPSLEVPEEYKGIGVRIEDDVLVTEEGYEVLSCGVPKEIDEIESLMNDG